jgi:hypothetical protein
MEPERDGLPRTQRRCVDGVWARLQSLCPTFDERGYGVNLLNTALPEQVDLRDA